MALKFKLVMRKNLGEDHESIPEKVYAQMVYGDLVTFDEFAEEVADSSGVGSASVKAVLDRMNVVLVRHLQHGRRVSVGELGLFRFCFGSSGVPDEKTFSTNLIREPKVRFYPGKALRVAKSRTSFEKTALPNEEDAGGNGSDSGFWIDPQGLIDNSVLVAFGEISTFAGALFGVDYSYKLKINN